MEETTRITIEETLSRQRSFFASGQTASLKFRLGNLARLDSALHQWEGKLADALREDLHKSYEEAYMTEFSMVYQEIRNHRKHLKRWSRPKRVPSPLHLLPSTGKILRQPLGVALIISPWNYPVQLMLNPLVGAISSGCCAMLKPSPYSPSMARVMEEMISETFDSSYISIVQGGRSVNGILLEQHFDLIFFTGSPKLGKVVMQAASKNLTPVVLELGGKSPVIVDADANLDIAAQRIAWGKTINAGQTCIAPDYLLVHQSVKNELLKKIAASIERMFGPDIQQNKFYPRIIRPQAIERLQNLMKHGKIVYGGQVDPADRYIAPTLIDEIDPADPIMQEEIFGPILPVMTFDKLDEAISYINSHEKPLALYYFGRNGQARQVLDRTASGGGCINDTLLHVANHRMPFGGTGNSGMGKYHGHESFLAFSHTRSILTSSTWIDLLVKYPSYKGFKWIKKIL
ncbi:MAG: aldehyde dehydrogenase [Bacteroidota bacterium]